MYLVDSFFVKIYDFDYLSEEFELFLLDLHNYNCVLQNYFFSTFSVFLVVLSLVYMSDSPYVNSLEQPRF